MSTEATRNEADPGNEAGPRNEAGRSNDADGVDLHLHSHHSDGVLTPTQVVDLAAAGGVRLLALTDHDTIAGLDETRTQATGHGIITVPGVELSATWNAQTVHVLGFDFDTGNAALQKYLTAVQEQRRERLREIGRRFDRKRIAVGPGAASKHGVTSEHGAGSGHGAGSAPGVAATPTAAGQISAIQLVADIESKHSVVTRTHLARALVAAGAARSIGEAFKRFLGRGAPGHVGSTYPSLADAVACLKAAGGIAVLAHPLRYTLSAGARRKMLEEFRAAGGSGIEVVCGNARAHIDGLAQLARRFGLDGSVGSDFHDPQIPWNPPGRLAKLPASVSPVWRHFRLPN